MTTRVTHQLAIEYVPLAKLKTYPGNARVGDVDAIAESMDENGIFDGIAVQRSTGYVLDGNHRYLALQQMGEELAPVIWLDVDDDRARRIVLAANRTNDIATYDDGLLVELLQGLPDLTGTGYEDDDLQDLIDKLNSDGPAPGSADFAEAPEEDNYVAQFAVTVICRDEAHQEATFEKLTAQGYTVKVVTV